MATPQVINRNYWAFVFDGAFFFGGMSLVSSDSVLPDLLDQLGAPTFLIALSPNLQPLGMVLTSFLLAHRVEAMGRFKPFAVAVSIPQRLAVLLAVAALWYVAPSHPQQAAWLVAASQVMVGACGGLGLTAFYELFIRLLPENRIASNVALRQFLGMLLGAAMGLVVTWVLTGYPGWNGFAILFLLQFAFVMLSFGAFVLLREEPGTPRPVETTLWKNLASLPSLFKAHPALRLLLLLRAFGVGIGLAAPFLVLYLREAEGFSGRWLGWFVTAQMVGALIGNAGAAWVGDHFGPRIPLLTGRAVLVLCPILPLMMPTIFTGCVAFFLLGMGTAMALVGEQVVLIRVTTGLRRPTLIAAQGLILAPIMLGTAWAGSWVYNRGGFIVSASCAAILMLGAIWTAMLLLQRLDQNTREGKASQPVGVPRGLDPVPGPQESKFL